MADTEVWKQKISELQQLALEAATPELKEEFLFLIEAYEELIADAERL